MHVSYRPFWRREPPPRGPPVQTADRDIASDIYLSCELVRAADRNLDDTTKLNAVQAFKRVEEKTGREVELRTV